MTMRTNYLEIYVRLFAIVHMPMIIQKPACHRLLTPAFKLKYFWAYQTYVVPSLIKLDVVLCIDVSCWKWLAAHCETFVFVFPEMKAMKMFPLTAGLERLWWDTRTNYKWLLYECMNFFYLRLLSVLLN